MLQVKIGLQLHRTCHSFNYSHIETCSCSCVRQSIIIMTRQKIYCDKTHVLSFCDWLFVHRIYSILYSAKKNHQALWVCTFKPKLKIMRIETMTCCENGHSPQVGLLLYGIRVRQLLILYCSLIWGHCRTLNNDNNKKYWLGLQLHNQTYVNPPSLKSTALLTAIRINFLNI